MLRRIAPIGGGNDNYGYGNLRAWWRIIVMRMPVHAEEEIRLVSSGAADMLKSPFPNAFFDMAKNDDGEYVFKNENDASTAN